jgi:hypothetical protein
MRAVTAQRAVPTIITNFRLQLETENASMTPLKFFPA